jgi:predicted O-methyltransferase YrrM
MKLHKFIQEYVSRLTLPLWGKNNPKKKNDIFRSTTLSDAELLRENKLNCSWPDLYYGNVDTLAHLISAESILEIGVAWGYHSEHLLMKMPNVKYVGIDPYLAAYDKEDAFPKFVAELFNSNEQDSMNRLHTAVKSYLEEIAPERVRIVREKSLRFAENCNEKFDLIFLDGDHTYSNVLQELRVFWNLCEKGGIMCGDDYDWPAVKKAVDQFAQENNIITYFLSKESRGYPTFFFKK